METAVSVRLSGDTCVSSGAHSFGQVVRKGPVNIRPLLKRSRKGTHEAIYFEVCKVSLQNKDSATTGDISLPGKITMARDTSISTNCTTKMNAQI